MDIKACKSEIEKYERMFERGDYSKTDSYLNSIRLGKRAGVLSPIDVEQCYIRAKSAMGKGYDKMLESAGTELKQRDEKAVNDYMREVRAATNAYVTNMELLFADHEGAKSRLEKT
jgi:hypothetical protein